ncbi:hypothetical protein ACIQUQ_27825 [Streptomyces sp. NPDC101118]|uniref:hypothetical protein n=1 Tax=Streptomyces sp. NPDC101118 TaxID=3366109 RepID=UPI003812BED7
MGDLWQGEVPGRAGPPVVDEPVVAEALPPRGAWRPADEARPSVTLVVEGRAPARRSPPRGSGRPPRTA